jgi:hypothetical protein
VEKKGSLKQFQFPLQNWIRKVETDRYTDNVMYTYARNGNSTKAQKA